MNAGFDVSFGEVAAALALVAVAVAVSAGQRAHLEAEIGVAVLRSFVQLTAIGYVIAVIFEGDSLLLVIALLAAMSVFGALTARRRARSVPGALLPLVIALTLAGAGTLALVVAVGVFPAEARFLVPVGGMVIGNSMTAAAVVLNRLGDDMASSTARIEAALALGATSKQAAGPLLRSSLRSGLIPLIDATKTTGVIFFPGTMVGMLLAGADPADAVRLQLVLLWVLLGSVAIAALVVVRLCYRNFFTSAHQLREAGGARSE